MDPPINDRRLIAEARNILLLLENSKGKEAIQAITQIDSELAKQGVSNLDTNVLALWEQVGIAANNMPNVRYFEDVKQELNRAAFDYNQKHAA